MMGILKFLGLAIKWLPWIPFARKVVEETNEAISKKEIPDKNDLREIVESMPGVPDKKDAA